MEPKPSDDVLPKGTTINDLGEGPKEIKKKKFRRPGKKQISKGIPQEKINLKRPSPGKKIIQKNFREGGGNLGNFLIGIYKEKKFRSHPRKNKFKRPPWKKNSKGLL